MSLSKKALAALAVAAIGLSGCSGNADFKNRYAAADFGMSYQEADPQASGSQMEKRIGEELKQFDAAFAKLATLTDPLPGPVQGQVRGYVGEVKKVADQTIKPKLMAAAKSDATELATFLKAHNLFAEKSHPYGYNLVDRLQGEDGDAVEANKLVDEANAVLKEAGKVTAAIALAKRLVEVSRADVTALKAAPSRAKFAGIGLITVSATRNTLSSLAEAQSLLPRVQGLLDKTKGVLMAKPMLGMKLGGLPGQLGGATAGLAGVAKDGPGLLGGLAGLAQDLAALK